LGHEKLHTQELLTEVQGRPKQFFSLASGLWRIARKAGVDLYNQSRTTAQKLLAEKSFHNQLEQWYDSVPAQLRKDSQTPQVPSLKARKSDEPTEKRATVLSLC
jgi:hypothetical protein